MAFCNSCGANLDPGTRFCNRCGAAVSAPAVGAPAAGTPPAAQGGGSGVLKVILIVVGVFVILGVLAVSTIAFVAWRVARNTHVRHEGDHVKIESPFGSVETPNNPEDAARSVGVDIYPGAQVQKNGSATVTFGSIHTASAVFTSADSVDQVSSFYKAKFPNATVTTSDQNRCTIIQQDQKNMTTISIEGSGGQTKIQITHVTHPSTMSSAPATTSN